MKPTFSTIDDQLGDVCDDCTIIDIGIKIETLTSKDAFNLNFKCQTKCLEYRDSTLFFIDQLWSFSCKSILLDVDSIEDFKNNMKLVLVFEKLPKGAPGLFCQILDLIGGVLQIDQNRMMVILTIILEDCLTDQFKTVFNNEKNARRNLNKFLTKTGSILCFQEAIKILHRMYREGINLKTVLPYLENIPEIFR